MTIDVPKINCKFCNEILITDGDIKIISTVFALRCPKCVSRIHSPIRNGLHSKHTVYFLTHTLEKTAESFILDQNIHIAVNYVFQKTTFSQYIFGGPMEIELIDLVSIPLTEIDPLDPDLMQKIKLYITFS